MTRYEVSFAAARRSLCGTRAQAAERILRAIPRKGRGSVKLAHPIGSLVEARLTKTRDAILRLVNRAAIHARRARLEKPQGARAGGTREELFAARRHVQKIEQMNRAS